MKVALLLLAIVFSACQKPLPPRPWAEAEKKNLPPAVAHKDYTPSVIPNGQRAKYQVIDGIKIFHLTAEPIEWEFAPNFKVHTWGYNGLIPGPVLELAEGDHVRIYVTNLLPAPTTTHWHGVLLPNGMDGVGGVTQPPIPPGETYMYEFYFPDAGTFMYHSHFDNLIQEGMGLTGMIVVHKREPDVSKRPDRDFVIMLHEWDIEVGTFRPYVTHMGGFNILTMNGKVMPATEPLVAEIGNRVWVRYGNLSAMDHHPIHLHGYNFKIIGSDGGFAPDPSVLMPETTVLVPVGAAKVIEFIANNPGDWVFHCHMTHHTINQMGPKFPNMLGVEIEDFDEKVQALIPEYKTFGCTGLHDMTQSGLPIPLDSIPTLGYDSHFAKTVFGGMANLLKVREKTDDYKDPGPYLFPKNTSAAPATKSDLMRDKITLPKRKT